MSQLFDEATQFTDETTGELLSGGFVYIGSNGLDAKLNPITIYPDRELSGTPLANPQTLGTDGRVQNKIWVAGKYSMKVESSANVQKYNQLENGADEQVGNTLLINSLGTNDIVASGSPTVTALVDNQTYIFTAPANNTGAMTLKIDSTAIMPLKIHHDQALASGDIKASQKVVLVANLTDSVYEVQTDLSGVTFNGVENVNNKTMAGTTLTSPVINGAIGGTSKLKGIEILEEVVQLSSATTINAWVTQDMSVLYAQAATDGATSAIIRIEARTGVATSMSLRARKVGAVGGGREVFFAESGSDTRISGESTVKLDSSSDFEYNIGLGGGTLTEVTVSLVGYYV